MWWKVSRFFSFWVWMTPKHTTLPQPFLHSVPICWLLPWNKDPVIRMEIPITTTEESSKSVPQNKNIMKVFVDKNGIAHHGCLLEIQTVHQVIIYMIYNVSMMWWPWNDQNSGCQMADNSTTTMHNCPHLSLWKISLWNFLIFHIKDQSKRRVGWHESHRM